jgi:Hemolysins and related proteins containing CBS domains
MISSEFWATILKVASVPFLVLLNGFFVTAEFALVKIRETQLATLVSTGHRRAKVARRIVHQTEPARADLEHSKNLQKA